MTFFFSSDATELNLTTVCSDAVEEFDCSKYRVQRSTGSGASLYVNQREEAVCTNMSMSLLTVPNDVFQY